VTAKKAGAESASSNSESEADEESTSTRFDTDLYTHESLLNDANNLLKISIVSKSRVPRDCQGFEEELDWSSAIPCEVFYYA
jgi:hypothetical protein